MLIYVLWDLKWAIGVEKNSLLCFASFANMSSAELGTRYLKSSGAAAAAIWQKKQRRCRLSLLK